MVVDDDKPSLALRTGRQSSMRLAIDAVAEGRADGVVSAGNTGALMAMAKFVLKTLPGIDRPAIASFFPTRRGESVMLDLGANVECDAENLVQFALMGDAFARTVLSLVEPTVGLLNVGSEDQKGNDAVRAASVRLRSALSPVRFYGFIEGDDIPAGTVDVVVTDGFTGNIAVKTAEGTAKLFSEFLAGAFAHSLPARIGYLFARNALRKLRMRIDPRRYNGAVFLGLRGIAVKSHGSTDAFGFAHAIGVAVDMKVNGFLDKIRVDLARLESATPGRTPNPQRCNRGMTLRSQVIGCGGYLPERIVTNRRACRSPRYLRRMDSPAHRHRRAPGRGGRRADLGSGRFARRSARWRMPA